MEANEIQEQTEHAHRAGEKAIGVTTTIVAVLLAIATLLSHRAHTEEVKLQTKVNDQWGFYQAKHSRAHQYGALAEIAALLPNGHDLALKDLNLSIEEECGRPVEKGCSSPVVRNSPVLQQLAADAGIADDAKSGSEAGGAGNVSHEAGAEKKTTPSAREPKTQHHGAKATSKEGKAKEGGFKESASTVQERARDMENETQLIEQKANYYDGSELFLEIAIVLCSVALLAENKVYWKFSLVSTAAGIAIAAWGFLLY
jgi:Domain of unknown function (DUF4337)